MRSQTTRHSNEIWLVGVSHLDVWTRNLERPRDSDRAFVGRPALLFIRDHHSRAVLAYRLFPAGTKNAALRDALPDLFEAALRPELAPEHLRPFAGYRPRAVSWPHTLANAVLTSRFREDGILVLDGEERRYLHGSTASFKKSLEASGSLLKPGVPDTRPERRIWLVAGEKYLTTFSRPGRGEWSKHRYPSRPVPWAAIPMLEAIAPLVDERIIRFNSRSLASGEEAPAIAFKAGLTGARAGEQALARAGLPSWLPADLPDELLPTADDLTGPWPRAVTTDEQTILQARPDLAPLLPPILFPRDSPAERVEVLRQVLLRAPPPEGPREYPGLVRKGRVTAPRRHHSSSAIEFVASFLYESAGNRLRPHGIVMPLVWRESLSTCARILACADLSWIGEAEAIEAAGPGRAEQSLARVGYYQPKPRAGEGPTAFAWRLWNQLSPGGRAEAAAMVRASLSVFARDVRSRELD